MGGGGDRYKKNIYNKMSISAVTLKTNCDIRLSPKKKSQQEKLLESEIEVKGEGTL